MILTSLALLAAAGSAYAQQTTCLTPFPAPTNATVTHPVYFPALGSGANSAVYLGNDGTISFTAKNPWVTGRNITNMYLGFGGDSQPNCKLYVENPRVKDNCDEDVVLTGKWDNNTVNGLRNCGNW